MFRPAPAQPDLVALEDSELDRWRERRVFERSVEARDGAERWVFYEGPPTANGRPGLHHVWARVYKDLFCRYRTMRGYLVERRAGWDTHGLPVEVEVEKALGISGKRQIEDEVGIAEFVRRCRESVKAYVDDWRRVTERVGYWVDLEHAYWTFDPDYIQSVWWHLQRIFEQGLLYEDFKVVPYCPRCGTALSSHELGQPEVYRDEVDESAYVRLPILRDGGDATGARLPESARWLVVWTTTPWTLLSNTGAAVNPDLDYAVVDGHVVAEGLVEEVFGSEAVVSDRVPGRALVGLRYERLFDDVATDGGADGWRVVPGGFVTTEEGTGIVHLAPAFGEVDRQAGQANGLPVVNPVGADGRFTGAVGWLAGQPVRETNHAVNDRLAERGLLLRRHDYRHSYPHCWRCGTPLIYWAKPSWYIATSARRDELMAQNETVDWHPEHIKHGRFGEWLANNVDWALSRDRYWGTPLPVWRCGEGHLVCVGSLSELSELAGRDVRAIDPHRPAIDEVELPCSACAAEGAAGTMRRVEPVIDAWFDSGSMPAAQVGYPQRPGSTAELLFPADFITEAIDQTRGWFYSLLAVNTLVQQRAPYRHVMCLGHIVDAEGRKMSKSLGNVIDPWEILCTRGADALRWWMFSQGSPWTPTRVSLAAIDTALRDTVLTWWSTFSFFTLYASLNGFRPDDPEVPPAHARPALDRWVLSRLSSTVAQVTADLDTYEPLGAAEGLRLLVDDVSNWYVRRSRRRFYRTEPDAPPEDALAAQATLHEVLVTTALLFAPLCPFLADHVWRSLTEAPDDGSVHLADWPAAGEADGPLEAAMAQARRLTSLGRAARGEAGIKVRQPLSRAHVFLPSGSPELLLDVVADELNVDRVEVAEELDEVLSVELVPNFRQLGPRLGQAVGEVRPALAALDTAAAAAELDAGRPVTVSLSSGEVDLGPDDVEVRVRSQPGFAVSREGSEVVALEVELDDDLRRRGMAREVVRQVQDLRKATGLEVSDRVRLWLSGLDDLAEHRDYIGREVLAVEVAKGPAPEGATATVRGSADLSLDGGRSARAEIERSSV